MYVQRERKKEKKRNYMTNTRNKRQCPYEMNVDLVQRKRAGPRTSGKNQYEKIISQGLSTIYRDKTSISRDDSDGEKTYREENVSGGYQTKQKEINGQP